MRRETVAIGLCLSLVASVAAIDTPKFDKWKSDTNFTEWTGDKSFTEWKNTTDFTRCRAYAQNVSGSMGREAKAESDWFWTKGPKSFKGPGEPPLTLKTKGCEQLCGTGPDLNDVIDAFQILTTWVLPAIALMSQFPYESLSHRKRRNAEAFANWIGAPAAAIATTFWNIMTIHACALKPTQFRNSDASGHIRNSLYILSCVNQYEYLRRGLLVAQAQRRDRALLRGVLHPYVRAEDPMLTTDRRKILENWNEHLAFQLRLQRRKGVYPIYISILWFGLAFIFSIVIAFASLGDNSTAHSLALGLLLSWVPVVVFASVVDRNPTSATRCSDLIERWLFNIDRLFEEGPPQLGPPGLPGLQQVPRPAPAQWRGRHLLPDNTSSIPDEVDGFSIGEFLGQGRRLRYCGITDTVLERITNPKRADLSLPALDDKEYEIFRRDLVSRPVSWYITWLLGQVIVSISFIMAFLVSFNTPTVGLGCRSLSYVVWWLFTLPSWMLLGWQQEPRPRLQLAMTVGPNALAVISIFAIMVLQTTGAFNTCTCKSSTFGGGGGYMDFENGDFYKLHYNVSAIWGAASAVGGISAVFAIAWLAWKWHKSSSLWKVTEDTSMPLLHGVSMEWLS